MEEDQGIFEKEKKRRKNIPQAMLDYFPGAFWHWEQ